MLNSPLISVRIELVYCQIVNIINSDETNSTT
jgi:hypothetical protein